MNQWEWAYALSILPTELKVASLIHLRFGRRCWLHLQPIVVTATTHVSHSDLVITTPQRWISPIQVKCKTCTASSSDSGHRKKQLNWDTSNNDRQWQQFVTQNGWSKYELTSNQLVRNKKGCWVGVKMCLVVHSNAYLWQIRITGGSKSLTKR